MCGELEKSIVGLKNIFTNTVENPPATKDQNNAKNPAANAPCKGRELFDGSLFEACLSSNLLFFWFCHFLTILYMLNYLFRLKV